MQLHVFCDAAEIACGAVAYFHTETRGSINVSFVISKTRLVPIKTLTVPQLELPAAVMASKLKYKIFEESDLEINETYLWSDSEWSFTTSATPREDSAPTVYVSQRVAEIVSSSDVKEWHYIPSKMNIVDDCTRVKKIQELTPRCRWITVPEFVMLPKADWPSTKEEPVINEEELQIKDSVPAVSTSLSTCINMVQ